MGRKQDDLIGDVPGASQEDLFGHDARPRPAGKPRPAKKSKSDANKRKRGTKSIRRALHCISSLCSQPQVGELNEHELPSNGKPTAKVFRIKSENRQ
ncbi:hypothetical protein Tco_0683027 [Tanacetum coccineum]|uniref:Uncharacterized protein n=1 Tax=Tanacetum coccineum TaxID=301880 RepID=A0ABQ4XSX2_9ASTR